MTVHTPQQPRRGTTVMTVMLAIILASVVAIGGFVTAGVRGLVDSIPTVDDLTAAFAAEPYEEVGPVVVESIRELSELTTVEMVETTVVEKGTDEGWLEWARGDSVRLLAVAAIGGGVDLAGLDASDFDVSADGLVTVTLPHAEIQYIEVDSEATQVIDRDKGLFTKGDPQLESEARLLAETVLLEEALAQGILEDAEANAETSIRNLLVGLGYRDVRVIFSD